MSNRLEGKVAVITGGNSGIGLATAKLFRAEGAKVVITGKRQEAVESAVKEIGGDSVGFTSDASNLNEIDELYKNILQSVGNIDVLFLNAGIVVFGPIESVDETTFDKMVDVNFKGLFFNIQKAIPLLNEGASIILNTSIADQKGFPDISVYSATKAAVRSPARTISAELIDRNIRVNSIAPGPIDTPIFEKAGVPEDAIQGMKDSFTEIVPMKRLGSSDEIAKQPFSWPLMIHRLS